MSHVSRLVLLGPTGTGKERLARTYHRHLGRSGELVTINCATLSRERIVADLFGAEAGAYTGAQRVVIGAVERADGGTLFLDEIGEMPLDVQSQLLRFLDTGEYQRLGATGLTRTSDVFVVAATNRDLRAMVQDQTFRLDLFFRIALEVVDIAPLRDRPADVVGYLASQRLGQSTALESLQEPAIELLRTHGWPGNFRELANVVARLPRPAAPGAIDADAVRRLLGTGPLATVATPNPVAQPDDDWLAWLLASASAYTASNGARGPVSWGDLTTFVEQFLKPYALAHLGNVANVASFEDIVVSRVADTIKADRGTVVKQMRRFFESR